MSSVEYLSLVLGIISLGLTIYTIRNPIIQLGSIILTGLITIGYFMKINISETRINSLKINELSKELDKTKDKINLHERLVKLEREVFKR